MNQTVGYGWTPPLSAPHNRHYTLASAAARRAAPIRTSRTQAAGRRSLSVHGNRNIENGNYPLLQIDSTIASRRPITGCWGFGWNFVCSQIFETYHDARVSDGAALGVRWDATPHVNFKASSGRSGVDAGRLTGQLSQNLLRTGFSWRF